MPRGGRRPGAGRPPGSKGALPLGAVKAIKAASLAEARIGARAVSPDARDAAEHAFSRVVDVLNEKVDFKAAPGVLKAATIVCEAVAGPQAQKVEHEAGGSLHDLILAAHKSMAAEAAAIPPKEKP